MLRMVKTIIVSRPPRKEENIYLHTLSERERESGGGEVIFPTAAAKVGEEIICFLFSSLPPPPNIIFLPGKRREKMVHQDNPGFS